DGLRTVCRPWWPLESVLRNGDPVIGTTDAKPGRDGMQRRIGSIRAELDVGVDRAARPGNARVAEVSVGRNPSGRAGEGALEPEHVSEGAQVRRVERVGARRVNK